MCHRELLRVDSTSLLNEGKNRGNAFLKRIYLRLYKKQYNLIKKNSQGSFGSDTKEDGCQ